MSVYTVIGLCHCGCNDAFVEYTHARTPDAAARRVLKERERDGTVAAVIAGAHPSLMTVPVIYSAGTKGVAS